MKATGDRKTCSNCQVNRLISDFYPNAPAQRSADGLRFRCKKCLNAASRRRNKQLRRKDKIGVLTAYGGRCICCGETEPRFLTIDHTNNDGAQHRREQGQKGGSSFYCFLRRMHYPQNLGLQVLCFNCNCGRAANSGVCPHKENAHE